MNLYPSRVNLPSWQIFNRYSGTFLWNSLPENLGDLNGKSTDFMTTVKQFSTRQPCKSVFLFLKVLLC